MAEYIEREALLNSRFWAELKNGFDAVRARIIIGSIPSADVVEVVRCKGCKHYKPQSYSSSRWKNKSKYCCRSAITKVNDNDFCSYGERRTNDA